ncbi:tripartite tricarboxylate transporter TctB family protein [Pacificibacter marinus]|uniref:tripartite tricarboxylate transporter TctB family protein n=1 Tax=Pacificibacter marinus TaxID=658057 RepID=UPI001C07465D|nr:tripartite tricarboxylate transporter TctB family protein [Pacificibacter marinus]MBU2868082.1 tripartite tricarboxylate transporter TctB family protein [Pacificibacter marinus]
MSSLSSGLKDSIPSIVTLLVGAFFMASIPSQIADFGTDGLSGVSARTMPYIIAGAIMVFSLFSIVAAVWAHIQSTPADTTDDPPPKTRYGLVFLAFIAIASWIILLPFIGYNIATILLITSIMLIIGRCTWVQIVLVSLALSFPVNSLLGVVLKVYLPSGSLFD